MLEMRWASLNAESFPVSDAVTRKCFPPSARMCNKLKSSCWNLVRCWWCLVCGASECGIRQHSWQIIHWWIIPTAKHYSEAFISSSFRLICNHAACFQLDISSLPTVFMHCTAFEFFLVRLKFNTIIASIIIIIKIIINVLLWSLASYLLATNNPSSSVQCMPMVSHIVIYVRWYHHHHHSHDDHCDD